jgi:hypothetical protein
MFCSLKTTELTAQLMNFTINKQTKILLPLFQVTASHDYNIFSSF